MHKQIQRSLFFRQSFRAALSRKTFNLTILKVTQVRIWSARIQLNVSVHCADWCTCRRKCDVEGIVWDWEQTQDNNNTHLLGVLLFVSSEWASSSSFCRTKRFSSSATQHCTLNMSLPAVFGWNHTHHRANLFYMNLILLYVMFKDD